MLQEVDVIYVTRIEPEKIGSGEKNQSPYFLDRSSLARLRPNALILHPLPRLAEIDTAVDADPRAAYFRQTKNGVLIRMALLASVLD